MPDGPRFEALLATKRSISAAGADPERVLRIVVQQGLSVIPKAEGAIVQVRDAGNLIYRAASGRAERLLGRRIGIARSFAGRSMLSGMPLICRDIEDETTIDLSPYRDTGMRALMAVPLIQHGRSLGALKFYSRRPSAFVTGDLTAAELVAGHLVSGLADVADETTARIRQTNAMRLEAIAETVPQLIWMMTSSGETTYVNQRMIATLGVDRNQAIGTSPLCLILPSCRQQVLKYWQRARDARRPVTFECRIRATHGDVRWVLVHLAPLPGEAGDACEWIGTATDIEDRKAAELDLRKALRFRELLLGEANHRVKNSLQIVTGLLALHASRISHSDARARMMEARSQINTIARVHQAISLAGDHDRIELVGFLRDLAGSLIGRGAQRRAQLHFSAPENLFLPVEQGVPVALITGEMITNAVKYATAQPDPTISVSISTEDVRHVIEIADNGPGLPPDFALDQSSSLGVEIIFGLARQVGGIVEINRDKPGACLRLNIPISS